MLPSFSIRDAIAALEAHEFLAVSSTRASAGSVPLISRFFRSPGGLVEFVLSSKMIMFQIDVEALK